MTQATPEDPSFDDAQDERLAEAAESFDSQLRKLGRADWPSDISDQRLKLVLELLHATLRPKSSGSNESDNPARIKFELPSKIGRFQVGPEVGRGGFGAVFRAYDELLHRDVAIKAIPRLQADPASNDESHYREARAVAKLNHPNIVPLYEILDDERYVYLVSEFCEGPTLSSYLKEHAGPLNPRWAAEITLRISQAVAHAHDRGFVHSDIKPGNVLLVVEQVEGSELPFTPRLTDFGLVLDATSPILSEQAARFAGTIQFMSPEQVSGSGGWDARLSDIYSLGLLLFRMLTGRHAYQGATSLELIEQMISTKVEKFPVLSPPISADLVAICIKAIQKDPDARYKSTRDFANDLSRWLDGREVSARRLAFAERVQRSIRREPTIASLVAAVIALTIISSVVFAWNNRELRRQQVKLQQAVELANTSQSLAVQVAYQADVTQAYGMIARNDPSSALLTLHSLERYIDKQQQSRFDLQLLRSLAEQDWSKVDRLDGIIEEIAYVPLRKGFAVAGQAGGVRFYTSGGDALGRYTPDSSQFRALSITDDGKLMAVGRSSSSITFSSWGLKSQIIDLVRLENAWSSPEGTDSSREKFEVVATLKNGYDATIESLAFSKDARYLSVGTRYEPIEVFDLETQMRIKTLPSMRRNEDLSYDNKHHLAVLSKSEHAEIYQATTGDVVKRLSLPRPYEARRVRQSPDGMWLHAAVILSEKSLLYYAGSDEQYPIVLDSPGGELRSLAFSPSSQYLVAGSAGGYVISWDLSKIEKVFMSANGKQWLANPNVSSDQWRGLPADLARCIHHAPVSAIAVDDDGTIFSGGEDGVVMQSGVNFRKMQYPSASGDIRLPSNSRAACATKDGAIVFAGCQDGSVWSIDVPTKRPMKLLDGSGSAVNKVVLSTDDSQLAVGFVSGQAMILDRSGGLDAADDRPWRTLPVGPLRSEPKSYVSEIIFDQATDAMLIVRNQRSLQWLRRIKNASGEISSDWEEWRAFNLPTSTKFTALLENLRVLTFDDIAYSFGTDADAGPESTKGFRNISSGYFDHRTQTIIFGTYDGRLQIVNREGVAEQVSQRWKPLESEPGEVRQITVIAVSPGNENILTGSHLGDVGIWDAKTLRYLGQILPANRQGNIDMITIADSGRTIITHQSRIPFIPDKDPGTIRVLQIQ